MKKSELREIIQEELSVLMNEAKFKVGDVVIPTIGPHKGDFHRVMKVLSGGADPKYNIRPVGLPPFKKNRYHLGAAGAYESQLKEWDGVGFVPKY